MKDGGPAFPSPIKMGEDGTEPSRYMVRTLDQRARALLSEMSLRDWFAGMALKGMLANPKWPNCGPSGLPASEEECAAHWSFSFADAMLAERETKEE